MSALLQNREVGSIFFILRTRKQGPRDIKLHSYQVTTMALGSRFFCFRIDFLCGAGLVAIDSPVPELV